MNLSESALEAVVLSQQPRPEIYNLPAASLTVLGEYVATEPELIGENARQSSLYAQAQSLEEFRTEFRTEFLSIVLSR